MSVIDCTSLADLFVFLTRQFLDLLHTNVVYWGILDYRRYLYACQNERTK